MPTKAEEEWCGVNDIEDIHIFRAAQRSRGAVAGSGRLPVVAGGGGRAGMQPEDTVIVPATVNVREVEPDTVIVPATQNVRAAEEDTVIVPATQNVQAAPTVSKRRPNTHSQTQKPAEAPTTGRTETEGATKGASGSSQLAKQTKAKRALKRKLVNGQSQRDEANDGVGEMSKRKRTTAPPISAARYASES